MRWEQWRRGHFFPATPRQWRRMLRNNVRARGRQILKDHTRRRAQDSGYTLSLAPDGSDAADFYDSGLSNREKNERISHQEIRANPVSYQVTEPRSKTTPAQRAGEKRRHESKHGTNTLNRDKKRNQRKNRRMRLIAETAAAKSGARPPQTEAPEREAKVKHAIINRGHVLKTCSG